MNKKVISVVIVFLFVVITPANTLAVDLFGAVSTWFKDIICRFLNIVLWPLFLAIVVIMFIWAGYLFLSAQGDPTKVGDSRKAVIWAMVGVAVAIIGFSAIGLMSRLLNVTGVSSFSCAGPSTCGNGDMDPGEECDDGNSANDDGCSSTCFIETAPPPPPPPPPPPCTTISSSSGTCGGTCPSPQSCTFDVVNKTCGCT